MRQQYKLSNKKTQGCCHYTTSHIFILSKETKIVYDVL